MRLIVYATFLVCCALVQTSLAEKYKKTRDNEDSSVERPSKYKGDKKYKAKYQSDVDSSEENYKVNKRNRKQWEKDHDFATEKKYSKYTKKANGFGDSEEQPQPNKKNKKFDNIRRDRDSENGKRFEKKKSFVIEEDSDEDSDEDLTETRPQKKRDNKGKLRKFEEEILEEKSSKTKKYPSKHTKDDTNNDDDDGSEETVKFEKKIIKKTKTPIEDSDETEEEVPKKTFRKKIRVRIPDSSEEEAEEYRRGVCERKFKKGKALESCLAEESTNGHGETGEGRSKKIKYSIKFAHEKEKNVPNEENNIILKIHRGENKKYRYQDDDNDDSSEENAFPKRMTFLDEDDE